MRKVDCICSFNMSKKTVKHYVVDNGGLCAVSEASDVNPDSPWPHSKARLRALSFSVFCLSLLPEHGNALSQKNGEPGDNGGRSVRSHLLGREVNAGKRS